MSFMYNLEYHQLEERIHNLLNLIEVYKFAIVTQNRKKAQHKIDIEHFISQELSSFSDVSMQRFSLPHYNYYQFLVKHSNHPIEELTIGNTIKYIEAIQRHLLDIHKTLSNFL